MLKRLIKWILPEYEWREIEWSTDKKMVGKIVKVKTKGWFSK